MHRAVARIACLVVCAAALGLPGPPLGAQAPGDDHLAEQEGASLKAVCGKCHNLQVVLGARMSYDAWHETVQSMIDRGAQGSDDQLDDVMDYLHRNQTTINVNVADADELGIVLEAPDAVIKAIVARRKNRKFENVADLKTVAGVNAAVLDAKARLLFFK
jgi:DNA uptake protein ComE-like DNA-binding protein